MSKLFLCYEVLARWSSALPSLSFFSLRKLHLFTLYYVIPCPERGYRRVALSIYVALRLYTRWSPSYNNISLVK